MATYSKQLYTSGSVPTAVTVVYTVPAQITTVVRDVEYLNYSSTPASIAVNIGNPGSNGLILFDNTVAPNKSVHWEGRVVLAPAGTILISASVTQFAMTISGYELGN